ncbi:PepSY domain-containing protein [Pseudogracilibacillus sp. SO30301A]|uniref:PepSY domain-containing protein n=1 Tax=Pseudogracilibacillus sp. SO30301A TaxID=3098291 RepID=UPI00300DC74B
MKKKIILTSGVLAITIALGLGIYKSDASQAEPKLNYDEVRGLISAQYPGTITELELEKDRNRVVYEIEIENDGMEYDLKVDGNSGEIIKIKEKKTVAQKENQKKTTDDDKAVKEDTKDGQNQTTQEIKVEKKESSKKEKNNKNTVIDASEAIAIAQKEFPGTVTDVELDEEDGRYIYEIEIKANGEEAEIEIDAMTGEIIVIEIDED